MIGDVGMNKIENIVELYRLVSSVFDYKAKMLYADSEHREVGCILYDSFLLKCSINDRNGQFGAGIVLGDLLVPAITQFLGKHCSLDSSSESITADLLMIDEYCRLRLPDKFLEAYDRAYTELRQT